MKKIVCELCEGTEFAQEGEMFVCQGCGTKYTPDEAKAMMKEVEGAAAPASAEAAPGINPNRQQIDNLLVLASNAFEGNNNEETESFCNRIIELDVTCYKAWLLKGQAIGWRSTYGSPRVMEGANSLRKAVDFAPKEEKENVAKQAIDAIFRICNALYSLAEKNFGNDPTQDDKDKFFEFNGIFCDATDMFKNVSEEIRRYISDQRKEQKRQVAKMLNIAGVAAIESVRKKWDDIDYPDHESWNTYLDEFGEIEAIFRASILNGEEVGEKDDAIITRYKNRIIALEEPMDSKCYKREWNSRSSTYEWVVDYYLADSAKAYRKKQIKECEDAIAKIKNKAKEAKKARIEAYWEAHKEEKDKLESEKKDLKNKQNDINAQIADLDKQIKAAEVEEKLKTPSETEEDKLRKQVSALNNRRASLGIFAGKQKKQIAEEIAVLEGRISAVKAKAQEEKKAKSDEVKAKIEPLMAKKDEFNEELSTIQKRISAIDAELSKDHEE